MMLLPSPCHNLLDGLTIEASDPPSESIMGVNKVVYWDIYIWCFLWMKERIESPIVHKLHRWINPGYDRANSHPIVFTNRSSNSRGSGMGLILEKEVGLTIEVSLCFQFYTNNNHVEIRHQTLYWEQTPNLGYHNSNEEPKTKSRCCNNMSCWPWKSWWSLIHHI